MRRSWATSTLTHAVLVVIAGASVACGGKDGGAPASGAGCSESCPGFNHDGQCDDGGEGAATALCDHGSDCSDCGARREQAEGGIAAPSEATASVGSAGGRITLGRVSLEVPAGALEGETEIALQETTLTTEDGSLSAIYDFGPDGLQFLAPVTLRIPYSGESDEVGIYTGEDGRPMHALATQIVTSPYRAAVAETLHFTHFVVVDRSRDRDSFCGARASGVPDIFCTLTGRQRHIAWAIDERDSTRLIDLDRGFGQAQPQTTVLFSNLTTELVIVEYFEVTNAVNVPDGRTFFGDGLQNLTIGDAFVLAPVDYGRRSFRSKLASVREPRKRFFGYGHGSFWVFPEDRTEVMSYDFCLGYRLADGQSERPICGHYEGRPIDEPAQAPGPGPVPGPVTGGPSDEPMEPTGTTPTADPGCGERCGFRSCAPGLACLDSATGGPCEFIDCAGVCVPPSCSGSLADCQAQCADFTPLCSEGSCVNNPCASGACDSNGCCVEPGPTEPPPPPVVEPCQTVAEHCEVASAATCAECWATGGCQHIMDCEWQPGPCPTQEVEATCHSSCFGFIDDPPLFKVFYYRAWCELNDQPDRWDDPKNRCGIAGDFYTGPDLVCQ